MSAHSSDSDTVTSDTSDSDSDTSDSSTSGSDSSTGGSDASTSGSDSDSFRGNRPLRAAALAAVRGIRAGVIVDMRVKAAIDEADRVDVHPVASAAAKAGSPIYFDADDVLGIGTDVVQRISQSTGARRNRPMPPGGRRNRVKTTGFRRNRVNASAGAASGTAARSKRQRTTAPEPSDEDVWASRVAASGDKCASRATSPGTSVGRNPKDDIVPSGGVGPGSVFADPIVFTDSELSDAATPAVADKDPIVFTDSESSGEGMSAVADKDPIVFTDSELSDAATPAVADKDPISFTDSESSGEGMSIDSHDGAPADEAKETRATVAFDTQFGGLSVKGADHRVRVARDDVVAAAAKVASDAAVKVASDAEDLRKAVVIARQRDDADRARQQALSRAKRQQSLVRFVPVSAPVAAPAPVAQTHSERIRAVLTTVPQSRSDICRAIAAHYPGAQAINERSISATLTKNSRGLFKRVTVAGSAFEHFVLAK